MDCCRQVPAAKADADCLCDDVNLGLRHYHVDCIHGGGAYTVCTTAGHEVISTSSEFADAEQIAKFYDAKERIARAREETRAAIELLTDVVGVDIAVDVAVNDDWDD